MANKQEYNFSTKKNTSIINLLSFESSASESTEIRRPVVKRRRAAGPPPRLEWPVAPISSTTLETSIPNNADATTSRNTSGNIHLGRKRQEKWRSSALYPQTQQRGRGRNQTTEISIGKEGSNTTLMWVDKYAPTHSSHLCVAPKKVKEIKDWMSLALSNEFYCFGSTYSKLLVLTGFPGIGKSATVRVLAKELGFTVVEWEDANTSSYAATTTTTENGAFFHLPQQQTQLNSFQEFLSTCGGGFQTLSIVQKNNVTSFPANENKICSHRPLLLIEELPNLYNEDAGETLRSIMSEHVKRSTSAPTIIILSVLSEGASTTTCSTSNDLNKIVPESLLYDPHFVKVINCNAVTKAKMKTCLSNLLQKEDKKRILDDSLFESIWIASSGDIRSAINNLQFHCYHANFFQKALSQCHQVAYTKDICLTSFHALGKLLYAKRQVFKIDSLDCKQVYSTHPIEGQNKANDQSPIEHKKLFQIDNRPPLAFDPEEVINQNELGPESSIYFLSYHAIDFFEDESELCEALETFSDAALFLDKVYQREYRESIYPHEYLSSLASRAVAAANKHPAPNRFRSLTAPKVFEVRRKQTDNARKLDQLCRRLSYLGDILPIGSCVGSVQRLVLDSIPYVRLILPNEANDTLSSMHSMATTSSTQERNDQQKDYMATNDEEYRSYVEGQRRLLEMDDIVEDEDENSISSNQKLLHEVDEIIILD